MGLIRGAAYLFSGYTFVFRQHRQLIKFWLLPFAINLLVFLGALAVLITYFADLVGLLWARPESTALLIVWYAAYVLLLLGAVLIVFVSAVAAQALLCAPFNDILSERVEQLRFGRESPPFNWAIFARGIGFTVVHELTKLTIWLAAMAVLFAGNLLIPVVGAILFSIGGAWITVRFLAYDNLDYAMARREYRFADKWRFLREYRVLTLGFGIAVHLVMLIPLIGAFFVPLAAVGGTLLFCETEPHDAKNPR